MTPEEQAVIEAAIEVSAFRHALDLGNPAQPHIKRALKELDKACANLAAECDGCWEGPATREAADCPNCHGTGSIDADTPYYSGVKPGADCPQCGGFGKVEPATREVVQ